MSHKSGTTLIQPPNHETVNFVIISLELCIKVVRFTDDDGDDDDGVCTLSLMYLLLLDLIFSLLWPLPESRPTRLHHQSSSSLSESSSSSSLGKPLCPKTDDFLKKILNNLGERLEIFGKFFQNKKFLIAFCLPLIWSSYCCVEPLQGSWPTNKIVVGQPPNSLTLISWSSLILWYRYCDKNGVLWTRVFSDIFHGIAWCYLVLHGIAGYYLVLLGIAWYFMVLHVYIKFTIISSDRSSLYAISSQQCN